MMPIINELKALVDRCTDTERVAVLDYLKARIPQHPLEKEWGVSAEVILSAIARSSDLTKRGVRGIIAEAIFERHELPKLFDWEAISCVGDVPYDFLIQQKGTPRVQVRIQVKLQRMLKQQAMLAHEANPHYPKGMYVVEVQKTRGGIDPKTRKDTRPYRFGEFDILAVNMHPSTKDWSKFLFTLNRWLIPRSPDTSLIEIFQPVPNTSNEFWTDGLGTCLEWFASGEKKQILTIAPELLQRRSRKRGAE